MILIPILVGYYLIMAVGTFKMLKQKNYDHLVEEYEDKTSVLIGIGVVSAFWVLGLTWNLFKWAIR